MLLRSLRGRVGCFLSWALWQFYDLNILINLIWKEGWLRGRITPQLVKEQLLRQNRLAFGPFCGLVFILVLNYCGHSDLIWCWSSVKQFMINGRTPGLSSKSPASLWPHCGLSDSINTRPAPKCRGLFFSLSEWSKQLKWF